ncbi:MAG: hypothetical protein AB8H79_03735 [Myxococcota bacterium]
MPILPPGKISDAGSDRGRKGRRVGGGATEQALTEADLREECCTTCVQYSPAHTMMITERGPTCPDCMATLPPASASKRAAQPWLFVVGGVGLGAVMIVTIGLWWAFRG